MSDAPRMTLAVGDHVAAKKDIAVVLITVDRGAGRNYLPETLANLVRSGVWESPRLQSFTIYDSGADGADWIRACLPAGIGQVALQMPNAPRTANLNVSAALVGGAATGADWVLFLEDDVDFCADFLDGVGAWLDKFAAAGAPLPLYAFGNGWPACREAAERGYQAVDYPVEKFFGTQAFAMRSTHAAALGAWLAAHPVYVGEDGVSSTAGYDLAIHKWAAETSPDLRNFLSSAPSFVQHIGRQSVISPDSTPHVFASWPGRDWSYVGRRQAAEPHRSTATKVRMLWNGDAVIATGFAKATHQIGATLARIYDYAVLGISYFGGPHPYPYPIYPANPGGLGDAWGIEQLRAPLLKALRPDVLVVQNDPWNVAEYVRCFARVVPIVAYMPVDGKNCRGDELNGLDLGIFYTQFALDEARAGGYTGRGAVVPLGVDLALYRPKDREAVRDRMGLFRAGLDGRPKLPRDAFIVGNVNRNQPRKRLDLTIAYFADWVRSRKIRDAYLYLHLAPTNDRGWDVRQLAKYHGVADRLIIQSAIQPGVGVPEEMLASVYSAFDVQITTTLGEGFGLTTLEGLACGIPQIAPDWSALGDWINDGAILVPCTGTSATPNNVNIIGGVVDRDGTIDALDRLYADRAYRTELGARGRALAERPCYRWDAIGQAFHAAVFGALDDGLEVRWAPEARQAVPSADASLRPAVSAQGAF